MYKRLSMNLYPLNGLDLQHYTNVPNVILFLQYAGDCLCREGYCGARCGQCSPGYWRFPQCVPCPCDSAGSVNVDLCSDNCLCKVCLLYLLSLGWQFVSHCMYGCGWTDEYELALCGQRITRYDTSGRSAVGIAVVAPFWPHSKCSFWYEIFNRIKLLLYIMRPAHVYISNIWFKYIW